MYNGIKNTIFKWLFCFLALAFLWPLTILKSDYVFSYNENKSDVKLYFPEKNNKDTLLERKAYFASYSFVHGQSNWVLYNLRKEHLFGNIARKNYFKADPDIADAISPSVYTKSGFDRGHLAPAADFLWSEQTMTESFYMSNMSPQKPGFNRGIWKKLEDQVRKWAEEKQNLIIVVGPILNDSLSKLREKVSIPEFYYKIILDKNKNDAIAFLMKNESSAISISSCAVSIDSVEKLSGIDFFYLQDMMWQQNVECCFELQKWNMK